MKIKLVDVKIDPHEAQFGTCELCFSTGYVDDPTFIFEDESGNRFDVEGFWWNWGDYETIEIDNVVNFAAFVSKQDFESDLKFDTDWLVGVANDYFENGGKHWWEED